MTVGVCIWQIAREQQEKEALRKEAEEANRLLEIEQALEGRTLEVWPMIPNRKVLRVADSEEFDGRVSAEYRVKVRNRCAVIIFLQYCTKNCSCCLSC